MFVGCVFFAASAVPSAATYSASGDGVTGWAYVVRIHVSPCVHTPYSVLIYYDMPPGNNSGR